MDVDAAETADAPTEQRMGDAAKTERDAAARQLPLPTDLAGWAQRMLSPTSQECIYHKKKHGEGYAFSIEQANKERDRILQFHKDLHKIATPPEIDVSRRRHLVSVLQIAGKDARGVYTPLLYWEGGWPSLQREGQTTPYALHNKLCACPGIIAARRSCAWLAFVYAATMFELGGVPPGGDAPFQLQEPKGMDLLDLFEAFLWYLSDRRAQQKGGTDRTTLLQSMGFRYFLYDIEDHALVQNTLVERDHSREIGWPAIPTDAEGWKKDSLNLDGLREDFDKRHTETDKELFDAIRQDVESFVQSTSAEDAASPDDDADDADAAADDAPFDDDADDDDMDM